ncbi:salicylate hydroxylase [Truncatella angustata]|uniref:Salicylate hydroxylase n=1 Tax=Truncatella angustata TaxID=152316 RepID=A0A9P8RKD5_9PEZI|nr:salicylate hydroxylase [Truncatella angustata]KAH6643355.1 salicylate hydroxylase [Truncatella angustata]
MAAIPEEIYIKSSAPDGSNPGAPGLNVIIVGLGFCGLTAAIECCLRKMNVTVVEMYPASRTQGDVIDFFGNGGMIIESWDQGKIADQLLTMSINNNDTFKIFNAKNELLVEEPWLRHIHHRRRQFAGHRGEIHELFTNYATRLGATLKLGEQVVDYVDEGVEGVDRQVGVVCKSGFKIMGDVVLCADGPKSLARQKVLGLADNKVNSGYAIFRAHYFLTPEMRKNIHLSRFCDPNHDFTGMWVGNDLHGLIYSWNKGKDLGWVITHKDDGDITEGWSFPGQVEDVLACLDEAGFPELFKEVVRMSPAKNLLDYKLVWRHPLATWLPRQQNPRMIVLGDAAHCHLPTSGQGGSQSIEDGAAIAACLDKAKGDVSLGLRAFERIRFNRQHVIHMFSIANREEYHKVDWTREFVAAHPDALSIAQPAWIIEHDARGNVDEHFDRIAEDIRISKKGNLFELSVPAGGQLEILRPGQDAPQAYDTTFDLEDPALQPMLQMPTVLA